MTDRSHITFYSGGHKGAESEFGKLAEHWGISVCMIRSVRGGSHGRITGGLPIGR